MAPMEKTPMPSPSQVDIRAPMACTVVEVAVVIGAEVRAGQTLVVVEAMKMEHEIRAECDGRVVQLSARVGELVGEGELLVTLSRLAGRGPHLQRALPLASGSRSAGSPQAARKPRLAPDPLPEGEGADPKSPNPLAEGEGADPKHGHRAGRPYTRSGTNSAWSRT
jgi:pyruvate/2-oxoglutarate dehydrogenase complex dihydrolipoamide acyltransferase (E2) component